MNAATHKGTIIRIRPGTTRKAKPRPPAVTERTTFVTVFVVKAAKMGMVASFAVIFPAVTKEAIAIADECASPKPARADAAIRPAFPNAAFTAADANMAAVSVAARIAVTFTLKAEPPRAPSGA